VHTTSHGAHGRALARSNRLCSTQALLATVGRNWALLLLGSRSRRKRIAGSGQLSLERPGKRPGYSVLVHDRLQPRDACVHSRSPARGPIVAESRPQNERGWFSRYLLRPDTAREPRIELGSHRSEWSLRDPCAFLWSTKATVRQDVEVVGHRESLNRRYGYRLKSGTLLTKLSSRIWRYVNAKSVTNCARIVISSS
jgi:hypothetical protein